VAANAVRFAAKSQPINAALAAAAALSSYPAVDCLVGGSLLPPELRREELATLLACLRHDNALVYMQSQAAADAVAATLADGAAGREGTGGSAWSSAVEPYYGFTYWRAPFTPGQVAAWAGGECATGLSEYAAHLCPSPSPHDARCRGDCTLRDAGCGRATNARPASQPIRPVRVWAAAGGGGRR
jgi:hypothetical protein